VALERAAPLPVESPQLLRTARRFDLDNVDQRIAADEVKDGVAIDSRIAMRRDQFNPFPTLSI
jgi:hypothetical protein